MAWFFVVLLVATGFSPLVPVGTTSGTAGTGKGAAQLDFDIPAGRPGGPVPGNGLGIAGVPRFPDEDTLGFTTNAPAMDQWKKDTDAPISFDIDLGPLANKGQLYDDDGGYWLLLGFSLVGYFVVDNDGRFDSYLGPHDGLGDEPCHAGRFDLFSIQVNGKAVWTTQGENEQPCNTEGSRTFDVVPMTRGEPENQYRVPTSFVHQGKNTITIALKDTGYGHPSADKLNDGWWMFLKAAAMELVAPPLFISHGWNADKPPGGHQVGVSAWQQDLAANLHRKTLDTFGQDPWDWAQGIDTGSIAAGAPAGCPSWGGNAVGISPVTITDSHGIYLWGFDGKQSFRSTGCELANAILGVGGAVGYCYSCHPSSEGQGYWYIGYSMGGLIGRWAIQREGMLPLLGKYVSVGTPHQGSKWADIYTFAVDKAVAPYRDLHGDRIRHFLGWDDWWKDSVQARVYEHNHRSWFPFPHWDGDGKLVDSRADFEIRKDGNPIIAGLNADVGAMTGKAFAVAGNGGNRVRDLGAILAGQYGLPIALLPDGDLIVSVDSATLGGRFANTVCFAVHIEGVPTVPMYMYNDDCVQPFFEFLMGYRNPGKVSGLAAGDEPPTVPMAEAGSFEVDLDPDDVTGEAHVEQQVTVEAAPRAYFQAFWADEAHLADLSLVSPGGQELTAQNASTFGAVYDERPMEGLTRALLAVDDPEPGTWTVRLAANDDTPAWGVGILLLAGTESAVRLDVRAAGRIEPGAMSVLTATLPGVLGATITANVQPANATLSFHDDGLAGDAAAGDGVWSAQLAGQDAGTQVVDVAASGTLDGHAVARSARIALTIAPRADLRLDALSLDAPQAWFGDAVRATARVTNLGTANATGVHVAWSDDTDTRRTPALRFDSDIGTLGPGEARTVQVSWMPSPGMRVLRAGAYQDGIEERLEDNVASVPLDVLPSPRTAATLRGPQVGAWFTAPPTVTLAPFDGTPAPYAGTSWQLDQGAWQAYTGPFAVGVDGAHTLRFQSTDTSGRVEPLREVDVRVDTSPPAVDIVRPGGADIETLDRSVPSPVGLTMPVLVGPVDIEVASGDGASGVARITLRLDGSLVRSFESPESTLRWTWDSTTASTGRHTLNVTATDAAGWSAAAQRVVYVTASRAAQVDNDPHATVARILPPVS